MLLGITVFMIGMLGVTALNISSLKSSTFAERFIDGREFNFSIFEKEGNPHLLPLAEMCFTNYNSDKPHIVGYRAKWHADSFEYQHTVRNFDFSQEDEPLIEELSNIALKCWNVFGLRGYARVDFRVDDQKRPFVLEINANPCLSPDAGFAAAIERAGLTYRDVVNDIVNSVFSRPEPKMPEKTVCHDAELTFREELTISDRPAIERLVQNTGLFSEAEVGIAVELVDDYLNRGEKSGYRFVLYDLNERLAAYACYGPISGTQSSFDLFWIAVDRKLQHQRLGSRLLFEVERRVKTLGGTRVYVDTSGRQQYRSTRDFYESRGFVKEAQIRDFYGPSDDKIIYLKQLA